MNVNRVALFYPYVVNPVSTTREEFNACARRFADTYRRFPGDWPHRLYVVCCNGPLDQEARDTFAGLNVTFDTYDGQGWDIGCEQYMARKCVADFVIGMTARSYFHRRGWLKRFIEARNTFGMGLYGTTGSYEVAPHIRTAFYGVDTLLYVLYPHIIDSRQKGFYFESEDWSFTRFVSSLGYPCLMVTWDGCYAQGDWRKPANIFRSGDQSALLVFDRHSLIYERADPNVRVMLKSAADGTLAR